MPSITYDGTAYACAPDESVLDCLSAHGVAIPFSCKAGACQSCMMRAVSGNVPAKAQAGLKPALAAQHYFLACLCHPDADLEVALAGETSRTIEATVLDVTPLNADIALLRLQPKTPASYQAGQYVRLYKDAQTSRCYSLASVPALHGDTLHLHVRQIPNGIVSTWAHHLNAGSVVGISEPIGTCVYLPDKPEQNLLLIGTGSGLAPLYGIIQDALQQKHRGAIYLYHGSVQEKDLYLIEELRALEQTHSNFHYTPCLSGTEVPSGFFAGMVLDVALAQRSDLSGWRVFLCGNPAMVASAKREIFLAGVSMRDIYADPFLPAARKA